jgi:hypothetical protein
MRSPSQQSPKTSGNLQNSSQWWQPPAENKSRHQSFNEISAAAKRTTPKTMTFLAKSAKTSGKKTSRMKLRMSDYLHLQGGDGNTCVTMTAHPTKCSCDGGVRSTSHWNYIIGHGAVPYSGRMKGITLPSEVTSGMNVVPEII